ncbi:hypothetical protein P4237_32690 [Pseudomonas aeruginosa]|nr:hypothetical protein [Pseudomonas aeruginosa]
MLQDCFGCRLTVSDPLSLELYDQALEQLLTLSAEPARQLQRATQLDPSLLMGHVLQGLLAVLGTDKARLVMAERALSEARGLKTNNPRERLQWPHWRPGAKAAGPRRWRCGSRFCWMNRPMPWPCLRRIRAIFCSASAPSYATGWPAVWALSTPARRSTAITWACAFGLQANGAHACAERFGRQALEACPRDAWAIHAVAQALEVGGRPQEGIHWLAERQGDWAEGNRLAVHHWWHLALCHFDSQAWPQVLALYDQHIGRDSLAIQDHQDAAALLWRLGLQGVDVGERWQAQLSFWQAHIEDRWYGFNDLHAMLSFVSCGRFDLADQLLTVMAETAAGHDDNARTTRHAALPLARGLYALPAVTTARRSSCWPSCATAWSPSAAPMRSVICSRKP